MWYGSDWEAGLEAQYLSEGESAYKPVGAVTYVNLKAGWDLSDSLRLSTGIDNVGNVEPEDTSGYNDWNSSYDFKGRYFWAGASYQF
nr:TonB-dependent receptor [Microbulbifer salipaludis]